MAIAFRFGNIGRLNMENQTKNATEDKTAQGQSNAKSESVQQARGPELKEKMVQSQKEGEEYRASHSGADQVKKPGTSNTETSHKADH